MTGEENGVAAKWSCYRLALGYADAGEYFQFIKYFETTMIQLWAFLETLPKRLKIYIKAAMKIEEFENLPKDNERKVIRLVKGSIRKMWLSLETAVNDAFKEDSHDIQVFIELQQDPPSTAKGLLKKTDTINFFINYVHT